MQEHREKNILLSGLPGCGKSTVVKRVIESLDIPAKGFYTDEIRKGARRVGFMVRTLDGRSGILAHKELNSPYMVGRYGVNIEVMETLAVPSIAPDPAARLIVIDEIGKMECLFTYFKAAVMDALKSPAIVLGTVPARAGGFIEKTKKRPDVRIIEVTREDRDALPERLCRSIGSLFTI